MRASSRNFLFMVVLAMALPLMSLSPWGVAEARADETCGDTQAQLTEYLHGRDLGPNWIETTARDGKPLKIAMSTRDQKLYFVFEKTQEGIWAEGRAQVCKDGDEIVVKIGGKDIKLGSTAPFPVRMSMGGGAKFHLRFDGPAKLHLSTFGWSGDFIPGTELAAK